MVAFLHGEIAIPISIKMTLKKWVKSRDATQQQARPSQDYTCAILGIYNLGPVSI